jgi:large subunit ribosomal protein L1
MPKHGKKFREAVARVPEGATHQPNDAVSMVKDLSFAKFDETVEVAVRLGVDPRHADQIVRGTVVLPHGTGKTARVLVIAQGDKAREAEEAGADFVGVEFVQKIKDGMARLRRRGRHSGSDGPGRTARAGAGPPRSDADAKGRHRDLRRGKAVREIKAGKIEFRVDKTGNVHAPIGKVSFSPDQLEENLSAFMENILRAKPSAAKGQYVRGVTVSSTMGPGVPVDANLYRRG